MNLPISERNHNSNNLMSACTIDTSKRYVLVVEDNTMISMILEELLKKLNYQAILAENG